VQCNTATGSPGRAGSTVGPSEMSLNESAKIKAGFVLMHLIIGDNRVRRLPGDQVREGLVVPKYSFELHLLKQLAQLVRRGTSEAEFVPTQSRH
jgi:hypothetical protein